MHHAEPDLLRRSLYPVLITVAIAAVCGRILSASRLWEPHLAPENVELVIAAELAPLAAVTPLDVVMLQLQAAPIQARAAERESLVADWPRTRPYPTPTFGSNDRSRWATVRALVEDGTYVIGVREHDPVTGRYRDRGIVFEDGWQSVDKVLTPYQIDQRQLFYSSKPPLLPTLVAGEYWLLRHGLGLSLTQQMWATVRIILLTINALPFAIYLVLLSRLVERFGTTDWGRLFVFVCAGFATFLTTFATTFNNHTVAACTALFALYPLLRGRSDDDTAALDLSPCALMICGFFAACTAATELPATAFLVGLAGLLLLLEPRKTLLYFAPAALLPIAAHFLCNYLALGTWKPAYSEFGGPWYNYPGSVWDPTTRARVNLIELASERESRAAYAFHFLLGHHGVFSLTPIFLLSLAGIALGLVTLRRDMVSQGKRTDGLRRRFTHDGTMPLLALVTAFLTIVVIGFFLCYQQRWNYGGLTSAPRWLIWLTPFWLLTMVPVVDRLSQRRWGRICCCALLALSVISVSYPAWNPWRHPWIYNWFHEMHWLNY